MAPDNLYRDSKYLGVLDDSFFLALLFYLLCFVVETSLYVMNMAVLLIFDYITLQGSTYEGRENHFAIRK